MRCLEKKIFKLRPKIYPKIERKLKNLWRSSFSLNRISFFVITYLILTKILETFTIRVQCNFQSFPTFFWLNYIERDDSNNFYAFYYSNCQRGLRRNQRNAQNRSNRIKLCVLIFHDNTPRGQEFRVGFYIFFLFLDFVDLSTDPSGIDKPILVNSYTANIPRVVHSVQRQSIK